MTAQIDSNVGDHSTSSARISSTVGGVSTRGYRTYGIPTVRTDIAAPRLRRVSDRVNYGDEGNTGALLNPNIFYQRGVHERHFFEARSRTQVSPLLIAQRKYSVRESKLCGGFIVLWYVAHV